MSAYFALVGWSLSIFLFISWRIEKREASELRKMVESWFERAAPSAPGGEG